MLKTTTYKKLEKKLAEATKNRKSLTASQAKLIQEAKRYNTDIDNGLASKETQEQRKKLVESHRYKSAKRHWEKLTSREREAYDNLFKYKSKRGINPKVKPKQTNFGDILAPHARIYPTESPTSNVVYLFSQSENETNQNDVTKYTVDQDEPISDHTINSEKTLSIQGYLVGGSSIGQDDSKLSSSEHYYNQLLKFKRLGTQLTYMSNGSQRGAKGPHIYMRNLVISELDKTLDSPTVDSFKISISFEYVYKATVMSKKRNKNNKGKKDRKGKYAGPKNIRAKKGMTYYGLAKEYDTTVSQLERWNGPNITVGKKIRVTEGHVNNKKSSNDSKTKIYQRKR